MKKNYTTLILILSIIATIITLFLFVYFLKVIENKNQNATDVLTSLQEKMKAKENEITFAKKVAEIKSLQDSIDSHFVDPNNVDTFANYVEGIGSNFGSDTSVTRIEIPPKTENTIIFGLSINGTFNNVMKTISYLENIPYRINITQVYLNKVAGQRVQVTPGKDKSQGVSTWQADLSFNVLSLN
jgi:hypothetical protein